MEYVQCAETTDGGAALQKVGYIPKRAEARQTGEPLLTVFQPLAPYLVYLSGAEFSSALTKTQSAGMVSKPWCITVYMHWG